MPPAQNWMNESIDKSEYTNQRPRLTIDALEGADLTVATVESIDRVEFPSADRQDGKPDVRLGLYFKEYPGLIYYLNASGLTAITDKLGDVPGRWRGQRVPLERVRVPNPKKGGAIQDSLHVSPVDVWDARIGEYDESGDETPVRRRRTVAKKGVKKGVKKAARKR